MGGVIVTWGDDTSHQEGQYFFYCFTVLITGLCRPSARKTTI